LTPANKAFRVRPSLAEQKSLCIVVAKVSRREKQREPCERITARSDLLHLDYRSSSLSNPNTTSRSHHWSQHWKRAKSHLGAAAFPLLLSIQQPIIEQLSKGTLRQSLDFCFYNTLINHAPRPCDRPVTPTTKGSGRPRFAADRKHYPSSRIAGSISSANPQKTRLEPSNIIIRVSPALRQLHISTEVDWCARKSFATLSR
jgi:hypothetical protein